MIARMVLTFIILIGGKSWAAKAAPPNLFNSPELGFSMSAEGTRWFQATVPPASRGVLSIYRSKWLFEGRPATLTVRVDPTKKTNLKSYFENSLKEFPKYGYQILSSSPVEHDHIVGRTLEVLNRTTHRQIRQTVFLHHGVALIFACQDHEDDFARSKPACDQLIENVKFK